MSLWQLDRVMYLPLIFLFAQYGLRGPKDFVALARVVLVAAVYKAFAAVYVMQTVQMPYADPETGSFALPYANDAPRFDTLRARDRAHRGVGALPRRKTAAPLGSSSSSHSSGRNAQQRPAHGLCPDRSGFLALHFATPINAVKRKVRRYAIILSPVIAIYLVAGWSSHAGIFKPVQTVRSVVDPQTDASSMTREIENYDIIYTLRRIQSSAADTAALWEVTGTRRFRLLARAFMPAQQHLGPLVLRRDISASPR